MFTILLVNSDVEVKYCDYRHFEWIDSPSRLFIATDSLLIQTFWEKLLLNQNCNYIFSALNLISPKVNILIIGISYIVKLVFWIISFLILGFESSCPQISDWRRYNNKKNYSISFPLFICGFKTFKYKLKSSFFLILDFNLYVFLNSCLGFQDFMSYLCLGYISVSTVKFNMTTFNVPYELNQWLKYMNVEIFENLCLVFIISNI